MKRKIIIIGTILVMVAVVVGISMNNNDKPSLGKMTIYKSPTCGCCVSWTGYAGKYYDVEIVMEVDMSSIKLEHNIPNHMESCHTTIIGNYFVEGHVPIEAVNKLLEEKPDIDGIALPRMPSGSPGMPGRKTGTWIIYAIKDGQVVSEYMRI